MHNLIRKSNNSEDDTLKNNKIYIAQLFKKIILLRKSFRILNNSGGKKNINTPF